MRLIAAGDGDDAAAFDALRLEAVEADGQPPFSDQSLVELSSGRRLGLVESLDPAARDIDAVAVVTDGIEPREAELVVRPSARRQGLGTRLVESLVEGVGDGSKPGSGTSSGTEPGGLLVWAHGDHPAARVLAERYSFAAVRELLQLRLAVPDSLSAAASASALPSRQPADASGDPVRIDAFRPGIDDDAWLALNAAAFAHHPEQGRLTQQDLDARKAESWFDPGDFLIAWSADGRMLGFCWLKVERDAAPTGDPDSVLPGDPDSVAGDPDSVAADDRDSVHVDGSIGEFYAVGVAPTAQGLGLGRALTDAGLSRLAETGIRLASLYVDADNTTAVSLYRSMGFETYSIDVQYRRPAG